MSVSSQDLASRMAGPLQPLGVQVRCAIARGVPPVAVIVEPNPSTLARWGLPNAIVGVESYVQTLAGALTGLVSLVKVQPAAFERFGPKGMFCLARCISWLRTAGIPVILDTKRADHAPVLRELVACYVGPESHYRADGLTLLPYLGIGEITEVATDCASHGGLLMIVVQTSNAGAPMAQQAISEGGATVAGRMVAEVTAHNRAAGRDEIAVVVGGPPERAAGLLKGLHGLAVLPGWGRPSVDQEALRAARAICPGQVLVSMGSYLTAHGPKVKDVRDALAVEIDRICS